MEKQTKAKLGLSCSQWLWPGPERVFTDADLARVGHQPWLRGVDTYVEMSVIFMVGGPIFMALGAGWPALLVLVGVCGFVAVALYVARLLWQRPTRTRFNLSALAVGAVMALLFIGQRWVLDIPRDARLLVAQLVGAIYALASMGWWAVVMLRVQQIEGRLIELDEQDRSIRLARRLATAQIQPHFLFNTLASLQHWVDTRDERAGATLRAFTHYLRATLPMFERETLSLSEELSIVRSYLDIMQARLGERLAWALRVDPALNELLLPPGALLTLVENAIAHGIEPALRGGRIVIRAGSAGGVISLEVSDDGVGPCQDSADGVGLANTRARLQQQFADKASLSLTPQHPGCMARIQIRTT